MNFSSSANATMSSKTPVDLASRQAEDRSVQVDVLAPVSSGWKPAPSSSSAASRPRVRISPVVGCRMPATHFSRVDLPEPLCPSRPTVLPSSTSKVDVVQRPEVLVRDAAEVDHPLLERRVALLRQAEPLGDVADLDGVRHRSELLGEVRLEPAEHPDREQQDDEHRTRTSAEVRRVARPRPVGRDLR